MANERPIHEIRMGKCKAAIWANPSEQGTFYNVTFARIFKREDRWESTDSFGRDDLPLVAKLADQAHTWIYQRQADEREAAAPAATPETGRGSRRTQRNATAPR